MIDPDVILKHFYPEDTPLRRLLLRHSTQVRDKALAILANPSRPPLELDAELVSAGAMLHDVGILQCHAPSILCVGTRPYIAHGVVGAEMLRDYGRQYGLDLEPFARICERHTGTGITAQEVREQGLPIPERDYLPETPGEKLVCLADKFFSKSGDMKEKPVAAVRRSLGKFGPDTLERFDALLRLFGLV
ncbi:MAG: HD domain-containing protein [Lentisphaeria bacterium]|nr:HD domain-containing protein [Lentisphaeria bacterium]